MTSPIPIRLLTAVPICDGHDSAINTINLELIRHGIEVVYLGYHRPACGDRARGSAGGCACHRACRVTTAGTSSFSRRFTRNSMPSARGTSGLFGGGGGTITAADAEMMGQQGTDRIFFAGTPLHDMLGLDQRALRQTTGGHGTH